MKAKRRVTTAKDVRTGGKRTPTVRRTRPLIGSGPSVPMVDRTIARPRTASRAQPASPATADRAPASAVDLGVDLGRGLVLRNPVLVASDAKSNIFGFASAGPSRDRSLPFEGEVYTLYVAPGWTGQGIGSALLQSVFKLFAKANYRGIIIWALADNPSRFFYEAMNGQLVAERQHPLWGRTMREIGYGWRSLDACKPTQRVGRGADPSPPT